MVTGLAVAVAAVVAVFLSLLLDADRRRGILAAIATWIIVFVWTPATPDSARELAIWAAVTILAIAALLPGKSGTRAAPIVPVLVVVFFATSFLTTLVVYPQGFGALIRLSALGCAAVLAAGRFSHLDIKAFLGSVLGLAVVESLIAGAEVVFSLEPVWGYGTRADGGPATYANPLFPGLLRAQGTLGHPIPLGTLLAVAALVLLLTWSSRRILQRWVLLMVIVGGLLFSGTRITFVMIALGVLFATVFSVASRHRVRNVLIGIFLAAIVLMLDFGLRDASSELVESGSFTNRLGALVSVPGLLSRDIGAVVFGSGWASEPQLFSAGFLQQNGFNVVDNQPVSTLATQGVIGLVLLLAIFIVGFARAERTGRTLVIGLAIMLFSFDFLRWPSALVLTFALLAIPWRRLVDNSPHSPPEVVSAPERTVLIGFPVGSGVRQLDRE